MLGTEALRIAIPSKGRLRDQSVEILRRAGVRASVEGRRLFTVCPDSGATVNRRETTRWPRSSFASILAEPFAKRSDHRLRISRRGSRSRLRCSRDRPCSAMRAASASIAARDVSTSASSSAAAIPVFGSRSAHRNVTCYACPTCSSSSNRWW